MMIIRKGIKEVVSYVYQQGDLNLEYFQANRAQYGTEAHQVIQDQYLDEECEVYLEHILSLDEHEIHLSGRMDLLLERDGRWIVGEIKSTTRKLEVIEENDRPAPLCSSQDVCLFTIMPAFRLGRNNGSIDLLRFRRALINVVLIKYIRKKC